MDKEYFLTRRKAIREMKVSERVEKIQAVGSCCSVCGEDDNRVLALHHLFGEKNDPEARVLCLNCHKKITDGQNQLPLSTRKVKSSAFLLRSIGELLLICGKKLSELSE